jgi:hypothetical protein
MKSDKQLRDRVTQELGAVIDYRSSEALRHVLALFDALLATYQAELVSISHDKLERKQGAAMQIKALYDCIADPDRSKTPRV